MGLILETKKVETTEFDGVKITSFTIDMETNNILVVYKALLGTEVVSEFNKLLLDSIETKNAIQYASFIAQTDVYSPIKDSLYSTIQERLGIVGSVE